MAYLFVFLDGVRVEHPSTSHSALMQYNLLSFFVIDFVSFSFYDISCLALDGAFFTHLLFQQFHKINLFGNRLLIVRVYILFRTSRDRSYRFCGLYDLKLFLWLP